MSRSFRRTAQRNVAQPDTAITENSAAEIQLASAPAATDGAPSQADVFEIDARNAPLADGDSNQRHYIYSYGERAGNHTISDLSAGDKVYIWVEEGSSQDYTYMVQGADTLVTIGQSTILLKNFVADDIRDFVSVEQNATLRTQPMDGKPIETGQSPSAPEATSSAGDGTNADVPEAGDDTAPMPSNLTRFGTDESELLLADASYGFVYAKGGDDTIVAGASGAWLQGDDGNDLVIARNGPNTMYGGTGRDTLVGGTDGDYVRGDSGDDLLTGGAGNDRFVFFASDAQSGADTIDDFTSEDRLHFWIAPGASNELQYQVIGSDTLVTVGNASVLLQNFVADDIRDFVTIEQDSTLTAGEVVEEYKMLQGNGENELLMPDSTYRSAFGWGGDDTIVAGQSNVLLDGGEGRDLLIASDGRNVLYGSFGDDTIVGGSGNDAIEGGSGSNYVVGGSGNDTFTFEGPHYFRFQDTIADFETGDRLYFMLQEGPNDLRIEVQGQNTLITVGNSSVLLENFVADNMRDLIGIEEQLIFRFDPFMQAQSNFWSF